MEFQLEHWHWWVLTLGFVVWLAMSPKPLFIWLTAGTTLVGYVVWVDATTPIKVQLMLLSFVVGTGYVVSLYLRGNKRGDDKPNEQGEPKAPKPVDPNFLNKEQSEAHIVEIVGRTFRLEEPIIGGLGTLNFDGQQWRLRGKDTEAGNEIRIVSVDGIDKTLLEVTQVTSNTD